MESQADSAARSGDAAEVRVAELVDVADHKAATDLFDRVWRSAAPAQLVSADLMRALSHSGNYVAGAYLGDRLVGATVAFLGADHLHSHITGVEPARQRHGVGRALKQHQRAWAHRRGIAEIRWTYDPLVARNARFNLLALGAGVTAYLPNFYGEMHDAVNAGDDSDRLYVVWDVRDAQPRPPAPRSGARILLDRAGDDPARTSAAMDGERLAVALPSDVEDLRVGRPALATEWRHAVREALTGAMAAGYRISGFASDGFYLLSRGPLGPVR